MATSKNPTAKNRVARKAERGTTLVETLVALLVLSVGLLGIAALQMTSLRNNRGAHLRSQAQVMAYDIADRMRANRQVALTGSYNIALGATPGASDPLTLLDLQRWRESLRTTLPSGDGAVAVEAGNVVRITIRWADTTTGGSTAPPETFTTRTQI